MKCRLRKVSGVRSKSRANPPLPTPSPESTFTNAAFTYDGDGKRVKSDITTNLGTTTTYFVGSHYEVTDGVVTKYYYAGSQRIAMRDNGTLFFLLGDHLGSTSLVTFGNGNVVSETRYKAWGEVRYASGTTPTDYTYTGQYSNSYINLLWYGSRHYDPELGRFTQPDSIVPLASQGIQAYDRYAYVNNNPVRYTDPSGHCIICSAGAFVWSAFAQPLISTALGERPDVEGIAITMLLAPTDNAMVAAGLAVQSEYPWGIVGGNARGWAQATYKELMDSQGNPYSPGVATTIMKNRIYDAMDACKQCNNGINDGVDKLIVAAISQNGYNLNFDKLQRTDGNIDWRRFFAGDVGSSTSDPYAQFRQKVTGMDYSTEFMVKIFIQDLRYLMDQGYDLPNGITKEDVASVEKLLEDWKRNHKNR